MQQLRQLAHPNIARYFASHTRDAGRRFCIVSELVCVCACACARARACNGGCVSVSVCVRACVRVRAYVRVCVRACLSVLHTAWDGEG